MRAIRYLFRSVNVLNILLVAIVAAAIVYVLLPLLNMNAGYSLPKIQPKTVEEGEQPQEKTANVQPSDYTIIAESNLFHPERRIPVDKKAEETPKPDLILYGTMVQDSTQYAFIEDKKNPKTTPGRGDRQTTVKKGDTVGGFIVSEIGADRITLTKGEEKMTVLLADANKRKDSAGTQASVLTPAAAPTPVRPGSPSPASPFGPGAAPTTGPSPQMGPRPVPAPQTPASQIPAAVQRRFQRPDQGAIRSPVPGTTQTPVN